MEKILLILILILISPAMILCDIAIWTVGKMTSENMEHDSFFKDFIETIREKWENSFTFILRTRDRINTMAACPGYAKTIARPAKH